MSWGASSEPAAAMPSGAGASAAGAPIATGTPSGTTGAPIEAPSATPQAAQGQAEQQPAPADGFVYPTAEEQAALGVELFPEATERAYSQAVGNLSDAVYTGLATEAIAQAVHGSHADAEAIIDALAAKVGPGQADARQRAATAYGVMFAQAEAVIASEGVNADELFAWAKQHRRGELERATAAHVLSRQPGAWRSLAQAYRSVQQGRR